MSYIDPNTQAAIQSLLESDPDFRKRVEQLTLLSMQKLFTFLQSGTPDQQLKVAQSFIPIFVKSLANNKSGEESDSATESEKVRSIISGLIPQLNTSVPD